jgi:hypothetical protein
MTKPTNDATDEFIELYNSTSTTIDVNNWQFADGDSTGGLDTIIAWDPLVHGTLTNLNAITNTTIISSNSYAVILDPDYATGSQPYNFAPNTIILTINNTTSLAGSGLSTSDPVTLYDSSGTVINTYGTPKTSTPATFANADDDELDNIPLPETPTISVERKDPFVADQENNWDYCISSSSCTPGAQNSIYGIVKSTYALHWGVITEIMPDNSDDDFIEIFVLKSSGSISGYKLYEKDTLIKTFPDLTPSTSDYIIIHFDKAGYIDETTSKGDNNYWDFYTADGGLTATDNSIIIRDAKIIL